MSSFAQSATCEVCIPPDYAAACVAARDAARANMRAADVAAGARAGSEQAHAQALADLSTAHESIGRMRAAHEARWSPWTLVGGGVLGGALATVVTLLLVR